MTDTGKVTLDKLWNYKEEFSEAPDTFKDQIELFKNELSAQKLSEKTVRKHIQNVDFYLHDFGVYYEHISELSDGCYEIDFYFGDWYIDKCAWASKSDCRSQAASIKKFYKVMLDRGLVEKKDYQYLVDTIKENRDEWIETIERYDDWLMEDGDGFFDWIG